MADLNRDEQTAYTSALGLAQKHYDEGNLAGSLKYLQQAKAIKNHEYLEERIIFIQKRISDMKYDSPENGLFVAKNVWSALQPIHRRGVQWMWNAVVLGNPTLPLTDRAYGGLLVDDESFRKEMQVAVFVSSLAHTKADCHVLILIEPTTIPLWEETIKSWAPVVDVFTLEGIPGTNGRQHEKILAAQRSKYSVLLVPYGCFRFSVKLLNITMKTVPGSDDIEEVLPYQWPYLVIDNAHILTKSSLITKAVFDFKSRGRLLLTSSPVNKLSDFHTLIEFMGDSKILNMDKISFRGYYQEPIEKGFMEVASSQEMGLANFLYKQLLEKTTYWTLRRSREINLVPNQWQDNSALNIKRTTKRLEIKCMESSRELCEMKRKFTEVEKNISEMKRKLSDSQTSHTLQMANLNLTVTRLKKENTQIEKNLSEIVEQMENQMKQQLDHAKSDMEKVESRFSCPICMEPYDEEIVKMSTLSCGHHFCHRCISIECRRVGKCPICKKRPTSLIKLYV